MNLWKRKVPVAAKELFPGGYARLRFHSPEIAAAARPGQFVNILTSDEFIPYLRRPIGIEDADPKTGFVDMLVKIVGKGTTLLGKTKVGDELDILGPLGKGFDLNRLGSRALLVAGGTGIAPLHHLARVVSERRLAAGSILFYGGKTANDLVSLPRFNGLVAETHPTTEDGAAGERGLVTQPLLTWLKNNDPTGCTILCCGPVRMMKAVSDIAAAHSRPCFVSLETVMGCGIGSCLGCVAQVAEEDGTIKYLRACTDGPVFDASRLTWEGML